MDAISNVSNVKVLDAMASGVAGFFMNSADAHYPEGGFTTVEERAALEDAVEAFAMGLAREPEAKEAFVKLLEDLS